MIRFHLLPITVLWLTVFAAAQEFHSYGNSTGLFVGELHNAETNGTPPQHTVEKQAHQPKQSASASSASDVAKPKSQFSSGRRAQLPEQSASASSASYVTRPPRQFSPGRRVQLPEQSASGSSASYFAGPPRQSQSQGSHVVRCADVSCVCRIGLQEFSGCRALRSY